MCWYSSKCAAPPVEVEAGARLVVREMHGFWKWLVPENDFKAKKPAPACLADGSKVILRPAPKLQRRLKLAADEKAVFRMDKRTFTDVFVTQDGRTFDLNHLPSGLLLDVMSVPGREEGVVREFAAEELTA